MACAEAMSEPGPSCHSRRVKSWPLSGADRTSRGPRRQGRCRSGQRIGFERAARPRQLTRLRQAARPCSFHAGLVEITDGLPGTTNATLSNVDDPSQSQARAGRPWGRGDQPASCRRTSITASHRGAPDASPAGRQSERVARASREQGRTLVFEHYGRGAYESSRPTCCMTCAR